LSEDRALQESWRLLEAPAPWVIVLVIAPLVALISWYAYRSESLPGRVRGILIGLRTVSLCLLLLVLFRPVQVRSQENVQAPEVLILMDDSASMRNRDAYEGEPEIANAIRGLVGTEPKQATRLDVARASLETNVLGLLEAGGYEPRLYAFHEDLSPVTRLDNLSGRGRGTHVGEALGQALNAHRGRHVTDVIVVSDGRSNGGPLIEEAALLARAIGAPVHTIVVGDTRPERNLVVELVEAPTSVLEGDEVVIVVRVHGRGVGLGSASVLLEELDSDDGARTLASETIDLEHTGERIVLVAPAGSGQGDASQRRFRVSVPPLPEERILDDNTLIARVHVAREKIRVLYVEAHPRYEYRFLKDLLIRADERIEAQIYLASATPGFPQEASPGLPRLARVPTERRELLDNYDVVLLGDINPYSISPDPAEGEEFVQSLFEFVERGGGLGVIAGEYENPRALAGTEFARLLPVKLDPTSGLGFEGSTVNEHRPTLESPGNPHEVVRLHPDLEMNRELWEEPTGLRGYYWYFPVAGAKPGSQVLLRHPQQPLTGGPERDPIATCTATTSDSGATPSAGLPWAACARATAAMHSNLCAPDSTWTNAWCWKPACWMRTFNPVPRRPRRRASRGLKDHRKTSNWWPCRAAQDASAPTSGRTDRGGSRPGWKSTASASPVQSSKWCSLPGRTLTRAPIRWPFRPWRA
jgi:hypothetical protein